MKRFLERDHALLCLALVAACRTSPSSTTPPSTTPPSTPASATPSLAQPAAPAPQVFASASPGLGFLDPDRRAKLAAAFADVDAAVEAERQQLDIPGLAVGIVVDGELAYAKGFGIVDLATGARPDADTVYRIGSISKSFTGLAVLALRDDGALDLDDPLTRWIPEAAGLVYPSRDSRPITLRQLATHSAGLPRMGTFDPDHAPSEQIVVQSLAGLALDAAPGLASSYSNLGFSLLGIVAGRAARASLHEVIAQRILAPLEMTSTFWDRDHVPAGRFATAHQSGSTPAPASEDTRLGAADGAGGLYSSVRDLARYAAFQLSAYPARDEPERGAIRRATVREAHTTGVYLGSRVRMIAAPKRAERLVELDTSTYGFGWQRDVTCDFDDVVGHSGAIDSYRSDLRLLASRGVGVIVLTNFRRPVTRVTDRILSTLARTGALAKRSAPLSSAIAPAMQAWLSVYNTWDAAAFQAMLARPADPQEPAEVAGYKQLHGTCTSFSPLEVMSPQRVRLQLACERGSFELDLTLATSGQIAGFAGTSRLAVAPPELRKVADGLAALTTRWDDAVFRRSLGTTKRSRDAIRAYFEDVRAAHGACKIAAAIHEDDDWSIELACERGGALVASLTRGGKPVDDYEFQPPRRAGCPVR